MKSVIALFLALILIFCTCLAAAAATADTATADTATPDYNLNIKDSSLNWLYYLLEALGVALIIVAGTVIAKKLK